MQVTQRLGDLVIFPVDLTYPVEAIHLAGPSVVAWNCGVNRVLRTRLTCQAQP
jgi:hypothetical protein